MVNNAAKNFFTEIFRAENSLHWKEYKDFKAILYSFQVNTVFFHETFGTLENTFSKFLSKKIYSQDWSLKNTFLKFLPEKIHFENFIFKIVFFKNIKLIALIYQNQNHQNHQKKLYIFRNMPNYFFLNVLTLF